MTIPSRTARLAAGLIAAIAWAGLAVQLRASTELQGSVSGALWAMLRFFTVIANLAAALTFAGIAAGRPRFASPGLLGGVTLAMVLVGIVYALLLRGLLELSGGAWLADLLLHSITTVLVPVYWLVFGARGHLTWRAPWIWALLPLAYFVYALLRAAIDGIYPYPFMNVARLGWPQTALNAASMALGFLAAGFAMVWLDRRRGAGKRS